MNAAPTTRPLPLDVQRALKLQPNTILAREVHHLRAENTLLRALADATRAHIRSYSNSRGNPDTVTATFAAVLEALDALDGTA